MTPQGREELHFLRGIRHPAARLPPPPPSAPPLSSLWSFVDIDGGRGVPGPEKRMAYGGRWVESPPLPLEGGGASRPQAMPAPPPSVPFALSPLRSARGGGLSPAVLTFVIRDGLSIDWGRLETRSHGLVGTLHSLRSYRTASHPLAGAYNGQIEKKHPKPKPHVLGRAGGGYLYPRRWEEPVPPHHRLINPTPPPPQ